MFNKMSLSGRGCFFFVERDFPTSEKKIFKFSNLHIVFGILGLQKAYYFVEIYFLLQLFH